MLVRAVRADHEEDLLGGVVPHPPRPRLHPRDGHGHGRTVRARAGGARPLVGAAHALPREPDPGRGGPDVRLADQEPGERGRAAGVPRRLRAADPRARPHDPRPRAREGRGLRGLALHRARLGEAPRRRDRARPRVAGTARVPAALARGRRVGRAGGARRSGVTRRELIRNRGLLGLVARDVVSMTGTQMTMLALPWFVLTTTGSAGRMAIVLAVESASLAIFGFLSGNLVARLGPRRTMLIADAVRAPLVALVPLLHAADLLSFPLLLVLVAAIFAPATPSFAAKTSILPDLIGEDEKVLAEANAIVQAAQRITIFLGPALAGVLIAAIGATNVLYLDALSFAAGVLLVATLVHGVGKVGQDEETRSLAAGFRFIARDRLLKPWMIAVIIGDVGWLVLFAAMPVLVLERFGEDPALLGWIWGAWGLGAVVGNVVAFRTAAGTDRLLVASIGEVVMIAPLWLLLTDLPAGAIVAALA